MAEIIIVICFSFLAILGLSELLHTLKVFLLCRSDETGKTMVLVPQDKNFVKLLLNSAEQRKWQGKKFAEKIIIIDSLLCEENKIECKRLAEKLDFQMCDKSRLVDEIF